MEFSNHNYNQAMEIMRDLRQFTALLNALVSPIKENLPDCLSGLSDCLEMSASMLSGCATDFDLFFSCCKRGVPLNPSSVRD